MNSATPLILVVGMHRSGTSLLGSILDRLGVAMPGPLIPGDQHNPEGYFERADITALQEELLIDLQRWWPSEAGTQPLPPHWLASARTQRAAACLRRLLQADLSRQVGPWAIKDPRTSLLLPLWQRVAQSLQLPLRLVLAFRDPAEVVASLLTRDATATGMSSARAQALWLRHHQQLLHDAAELPLQVISYSGWFDQPRTQIEALSRFCHPQPLQPQHLEAALACIKPEHRRSHSATDPIRLSRRVQRWHQQLQRAAQTDQAEPLRRWAARQAGISAAPALHPWSRALVALGNTDPAGLSRWQSSGIPAVSLRQLAALNAPGFPGADPSAHDGPALPDPLHLQLIGAALEQWSTHLWIDRLPLNRSTRVLTSEAVPAAAALHLQPLEHTSADLALLQQLISCPRVFDPDPHQVHLLRLLGVNAEPLRSNSSGWLLQHNDQVACSLGLPDPNCLGEQGAQWLCLGPSQQPGWQTPPAGLLHLPGFPPSPALDGEQAHLLAGWLAACQQAGLQLVRLNPAPEERRVWACLGVACFDDPIEPGELLNELAWLEAGRPAPEPIRTPSPAAELIWSHDSEREPAAAICISVYNYADRLPAALESCRKQSLEALELLIVDDASSDHSLNTCCHWLERHGTHFSRVRLLRHHTNGGLAAARNTAFAAAAAPWCWVLDADNQLDPAAVERCLALAHASPATTAVVHPLIRIVNDQGQPLGFTGDGHAWQREQLQAGNVVDAMALVRRSAWQAVGGYSHIPGGWEDFDFWCKLIDADWHGVLYPQPLATYTQHGDSMLQSHTNRHQRRLSRLLQHRHPWLQLAFAVEGR